MVITAMIKCLLSFMFPDTGKYANLLPLLLNIPWEDMTTNQQISVHIAYTLAHTKFSTDPEVNLPKIFEKWGKYIEPSLYF